MDEEQQPHEPKIGLAEAIFVGTFIALFDFIELVLLFFGIPASTVISIFAFPATQLYTYLRGVRGTQMLVGNVLEVIPWFGDLPIRTIAFATTIWLDHHPSTEAAFQKAAAPVAKTAGVARGGIPPGKGPAPAHAEKGVVSGSEVPPPRTATPVPNAEAAGVAAISETAPPAGAAAAKQSAGIKEALGEEPTPFEKLERLFKEPPEEEVKEAA